MESFKVIIAGGRDFNDYDRLVKIMDNVLSNILLTYEVEIVCGMARGADLLGKRYAEERGFKVIECPADWDTFGKSAGYIRNREMADMADALVAFHDGVSKGTQHMINLAKERNLKILTKKY